MTAPHSVDVRTRDQQVIEPIRPESFWTETWAEAVARNGAHGAADAALLELEPLTIRVDGEPWTIGLVEGRLDVHPGEDAGAVVELDGAAFTDWIVEARTALGLVVAGRVGGPGPGHERFCAWDPVLRSVLDDRALHRAGDVEITVDLDQRFTLDQRDEAADFLTETGFCLLTGVFTEAELDAVDAELGAAVEGARPDDGTSWWARTDAGEDYPCRVLDLVPQAPSLRSLLADPRFLAIGGLLDDCHRPGDPFGEHFSDLTAEGLVKRVGSVEGLACLPWHKDCERGGHSMYCSGITIGICLTPVDEDHGGLDVMAGSHRTHVARGQVDRGVDLPAASLRAERGDVTVHLSCALHRSTHPAREERRVIYTGFALPPRPGAAEHAADQGRLLQDRAAIAARNADTVSALRPT